MKNSTMFSSSNRVKHGRHKAQRGAALVTTLLLLLLMTAMSVAMVMSSSSDMMINGYYRNFRGSFYAADSGVNIARRDMVNRVLASVPPGNLGNGAQPIPPGTDVAVQAAVIAAYGAGFQRINTGLASNSWGGDFQVINTAANPTSLALASCNPVGTTGTCAAPTTPAALTGYTYVYNYTVNAQGRSQGNEITSLQDSGTITFNVTLNKNGGGTTTSFAAWGMFIDQYSLCSGTLVPGVINGPVFTNGGWTFSDSGKYTFSDSVGSANANAGFSFADGTCDQLAANSDKHKSTTIAPTFQNGFNLGQPTVPLPPNDFSQKRAVLDGMGTNTSPVSNSDLNSTVKDINKAAYPNGGAATGVFLPYTVDSNGKATYSGGGILVEGDASVKLSPSGATGQVYTITQGGVTTTITIDNALNTTTVSNGGTTLTISGVPMMKDPSSGASTQPATMLYVDGNITGLAGPAEGQPAINDGVALTITAAKNVTLTGDILYKTDPVTDTQNQIPGTPADTLIPGGDKGQVLGIFTSTGDIQLNNKNASGNMEVDASLATISQGGSGGLVNTGSAINTLTIVGGRIQNNIKNINTTTRNVMFDRRFAQNNFAPPWFPSTVVSIANGNVRATVVPVVTRMVWTDLSAY